LLWASLTSLAAVCPSPSCSAKNEANQ